MMKLNLNRIKRSFSQSNILIVGDLMLDKYIFGQSSKMSPEAPIPIIDTQDMSYIPGGASNVANNIKTLGDGRVACCGILGNDNNGKILFKLLNEKKINTDGVFMIDNHPTTTKERIYLNKKQVVRIDKEKNKISKLGSKLISDFIKKNIMKYDLIIISDYEKGIINNTLMKLIVPLAKANSIKTIVDPKKSNFSCYKNVNLVTPNLHEIMKTTKTAIKNKIDIISRSKELIIDNNIDNIVTTIGKEGMILTSPKDYIHIKGIKIKNPDVVGAGDTVVGTIGLCMSIGLDIVSSCKIANLAASICVSKIGTSTIKFSELKKAIKIQYKI